MTPVAGAQLERLAVQHGEALADSDLPRVAVVTPNFDGRRGLEVSLGALFASDYPRRLLSVVVVDNGSRDGSVRWLEKHHPEVRVVANESNRGFAPATNQGVRAAGPADVLVFLNNDVRVEKDWLRELVSPIARRECQSTAGKMLSWDGKLVDHAGGGSNFHGIAIAHGYRRPPDAQLDFPRKCLFACGGAMAVNASAYADVGGFDDEYFAYYEDLDLGWRLWIRGYEVHYAPRAVCFHRHSSTTRRFPREMVRVLEARNPLLTCFKNYADENLQRVLPALLALALRRMWVMARMGDVTAFRIENAERARRGALRRLLDGLRKGYGRTRIGKLGVSDMIAVNDLLGDWAHWVERRAEVQKRRRRADAEIFELFLRPFWCVEGEPGYVRLQDTLIDHFRIDELFEGLTYAGADPHK